MRVLIAALLLCALFVPGATAYPDDECVPERSNARFCAEDAGCDSESGICRYYTYCVYVGQLRNCTYT